jgi:alpha-tubulin suppressor-like RCC1 family protein
MLRACIVAALLLAGCESSVLEPGTPAWYRDLAVGATHTCALDADGRAWCWGGGTLGQLGSTASGDRHVPVRVNTPTVFTSITAGHSHSCAVALDGSAWCWGWNQYGQLGLGQAGGVSGPVEVSGGHRFVTLSAGWYHTCGIANGGNIFCWGAGGQGQLGHGRFEDAPRPVQATSPQRWIRISAGGQHSCAISGQGEVACWGLNHLGQLGNGGTAPANTPAVVAGFTATSVSAGAWHTCAAGSDGQLRCWGSNRHGELGNGGTQQEGAPGSTGPSLVLRLGGVTSVAAGLHYTCAVDGTTGHCWGYGFDGQLGTGFLRVDAVPQHLATPSGSGGDVLALRQVGVGLRHACGLTMEYAVYCWGNSPEGGLGHPRVRATLLPVRVQASQ